MDGPCAVSMEGDVGKMNGPKFGLPDGFDPIERITEALKIATCYGGIDGAHHKDWVIDQMVRALTGSGYEDFVAAACRGEDGDDTYTWNEGIAP